MLSGNILRNIYNANSTLSTVRGLISVLGRQRGRSRAQKRKGKKMAAAGNGRGKNRWSLLVSARPTPTFGQACSYNCNLLLLRQCSRTSLRALINYAKPSSRGSALLPGPVLLQRRFSFSSRSPARLSPAFVLFSRVRALALAQTRA